MIEQLSQYGIVAIFFYLLLQKTFDLIKHVIAKKNGTYKSNESAKTENCSFANRGILKSIESIEKDVGVVMGKTNWLKDQHIRTEKEFQNTMNKVSESHVVLTDVKQFMKETQKIFSEMNVHLKNILSVLATGKR